MPALDVPPAPPRSVAPTGAELPQPVGLIAEPARNTPQRPRATPAAPAGPPPPRTDPPKPEPPKSDTPAVADAPRGDDRPPPAATLQTTPAQQEGEVEARIRGVLSRATNDLNRVDYTRLNANAKSQYDSAKRSVSLAEEAMRARNLVYAGTLADKAAELAAQLAGR